MQKEFFNVLFFFSLFFPTSKHLEDPYSELKIEKKKGGRRKAFGIQLLSEYLYSRK